MCNGLEKWPLVRGWPVNSYGGLGARLYPRGEDGVEDGGLAVTPQLSYRVLDKPDYSCHHDGGWEFGGY